MRLLVTGAGGQLGRDVVLTGRRAGHEMIACTRRELDITDGAAVDRALGLARPEAVINCAAYTDVDGAEHEPEQALAINAHAAGRLARAAAAVRALMVHVSSDYVFDGESSRPYVESSRPRPLSAYGRSKLAGEHAVAGIGPGYAIARSSWLFGTGGQNFVETMLALGGERDDVRVVTDQVGCPTWTGHLAPALIGIAEHRSLGVHHVAAGGECSWHKFAREIFRRAGIDCEVAETVTAQLGRPAPRPAYSVLRSERSDTPALADWTEGLDAYLAARLAAMKASGLQ